MEGRLEAARIVSSLSCEGQAVPRESRAGAGLAASAASERDGEVELAAGNKSDAVSDAAAMVVGEPHRTAPHRHRFGSAA